MLKQTKLGQQGLTVSAMGLGCMGLTWAYGPTDRAESLKVLHRAFDLGCTFWDTAEVYGPYNNEELIGECLRSLPREKIQLATKFGFKMDDEGKICGVTSDPKYIRAAVEGSLKRLGTDYIDLYYQHRIDPNVPIEEVVGVLADLVHAGKIKYIGLSEVNSSNIRRAHAVHPISAVQSEYSLWERLVEHKVLPTLKECGIGFVPYSPLGRGFLTGTIQNTNELDSTDWRSTQFLRIQGDNLKQNMQLVKVIEDIAIRNHVTAAQIALAWIYQQPYNMVPIPGTKRIKYLEDNLQATEITIPESDWKQLQTFADQFVTAGARYAETGMTLLDQDD